MKKTQEILGLPIISISDGMEAGKVKSIIINSEKGAIGYFVVDNGVQIFGAGIIPAGAVLGIGEYALTIENIDVITDINQIPEAVDLFKKDVRVTGTDVMTKKGRLIGKINDIFIDEDNSCIISGLEFVGNITDNTVKLIPRDSVVTFGKKLTVVKESVEGSLLNMPEQLSSGGSVTVSGNGHSDKNSDNAFKKDSMTTQTGETAQKNIEEHAEADLSDEDNDGSTNVLFEQKQRQYMMGRKATKTITDNAGNVIINKDEVIDDQIIENAKAKGKLVELVMHNRA